MMDSGLQVVGPAPGCRCGLRALVAVGLDPATGLGSPVGHWFWACRRLPVLDLQAVTGSRAAAGTGSGPSAGYWFWACNRSVVLDLQPATGFGPVTGR